MAESHAQMQLRHTGERDKATDNKKNAVSARKAELKHERTDDLAAAKKRGAPPPRSEEQFAQHASDEVQKVKNHHDGIYRQIRDRQLSELKNGVQSQAGRGTDDYRASDPKHQPEMSKMRERHEGELKAVDDAHARDQGAYGRYGHARTQEHMDHGHMRERERLALKHKAERDSAHARHRRDAEGRSRTETRHSEEMASLAERHRHEIGA